MNALRHRLAALALWAVVAAGFAAVVAAYESWPGLVGRVAALGAGGRPGERVVPTPEEVRRAQATWRRRRDE